MTPAIEQRLEAIRAFVPFLEHMELEGVLRGHNRDAEQLAAAEATLCDLEAKTEAQRREHARKQRIARVLALRLPVTVADEAALAHNTLDDTRALKAVRKWYESSTPLLVLSGPPGRGKTMAAGAALAQRGGSYVRALELARLFLAQFGTEVEQREKLIAEHELLVADDIGTERNAEAMQLALTEVLDARRSRDRRTIWVTNLSKADFEARYSDPRLLSRMSQSATWLVDVGEDLRGQK